MNLKKLAIRGIASGSVIASLLTANATIDPYKNAETHEILEIKNEVSQFERVEIAKDKAEFTLKGWNDEYAIKITPQIPSTNLGATRQDFVVEGKRPLLSKKMEYKSGDVTAFIEPRSDTEFDIDFTLDSKPDTNVFTYVIEGADDFNFFYQPALTKEEVAEGKIRPDNVVGSYAVYHKTKKNYKLGKTNYATGKIFHIYRPKAIDANGVEQWAELNYKNGVLSVIVDQTYLDNATYPVVVDPTFGYTAVGASEDSVSADVFIGSQDFTDLGSSGTVESITFYSYASSGTINWKGIVTDSSFNIVTNGVADSGAINSATPQWWTGTYSTQPSVSAGSEYVAGAVADTTFTPLFYDTVIGRTALQDNTNSYTTPTDPTDAGASDGFLTSIYATFTCTSTLGSSCTEQFVTAGYHSWTAPTGVTSADVACWGGGGGADVISASAGGGGGGGAFASSTISVTPATQYTIFIGDGGTGATSPTAGGDSTFATTTVVADGGSQASNTTGGAGGTTANSTGDVEFAGGAGGNGSTTGDVGGGGGGAGGPHGTGGTGGNGSGGVGGTGGTGSNGSGGTGGTGDSNGSASPGGGNGGNSNFGGGGGGGGDDGDPGGNGGHFGGGGGGGEIGGADGGVGACTVTYTVHYPTETVMDDFNDNSIDTAIWDSFGSFITETNQQLEIDSDTSAQYSGLNADGGAIYDLTGSYAFSELVDLGDTTITSWEVYPVNMEIDSNNQLFWLAYGDGGSGVVRAYKRVGGSATVVYSATYNSTTYRWFRIREDSGTTYWDTSEDGITWTNRHSESNPITVTGLVMYILAGNWNTESNTTTGILDNFNIVQSAVGEAIKVFVPHSVY